jgi:hydroxymethylglutaryl-CoA synthase
MNAIQSGVHTRDTHDFWRPLHRSTPLVDGGLSQDCYVEALLATVKAFHAANGGSATLVNSIGSFAYHTPFPRMVAKAHASLYDAGLIDCARAEFLDRVTASLELPSRVGNLYTGSLYLALLSVLLHGKAGPVRRQVGLFSYGSGFCAEFFVGTIMPQAAPSRRVLGALTTRHRISVAEYEHLVAARSKPSLHSSREPYAYLGVQNDQRMYVGASHQCEAPVVQAAV